LIIGIVTPSVGARPARATANVRHVSDRPRNDLVTTWTITAHEPMAIEGTPGTRAQTPELTFRQMPLGCSHRAPSTSGASTMRWIFYVVAIAALIASSAWLAASPDDTTWMPALASALVVFSGAVGTLVLRRRRDSTTRAANADSVERA
jgi:hypothetical protein